MLLFRLLIGIAAGVLCAIAGAQAPPDGYWVISFSSPDGYTRTRTVDSLGNVSDSGQVPWWTPPNEVSGGMGGGIGMLKVPTDGSGSIWSIGTVVVHGYWMSQTEPAPDHVWVRVSAGASWGGNTDTTGAVSDGFSDSILAGDYYQDQHGDHIVRKQCVGGFFEMTYHISAEAHRTGTGIIHAGCNINAVLTTRNIDLDMPGYSTHNMREITGYQKTETIPMTRNGWPLSNLPNTFSYAEARSVPIPPSNNDLMVTKNIDFGFGAPDWTPGDDGWSRPPPLVIDYQGYASSEHVAPESYNYTNKQASGGETLPTGLLQNGWDILSCPDTYWTPWYNATTSPKKYDASDGHLTETVKFDYSWADGCKGTAVLNMTFHPPTDNNVPTRLAIYENPKLDDSFWTAFTFVTNKEWSQANAWDHNNKPVEEAIIYKREGQSLKCWAEGLDILVGVVGLGWDVPAEAAFIASMVGKGLNIPEETTTNKNITPVDFADAAAHHRVLPDGEWQDILPGIPPESYPRYFKWKNEYAPDLNVMFFVGDTWDSTGYCGQTVWENPWYTDMLNSKQRSWYKINTGGVD